MEKLTLQRIIVPEVHYNAACFDSNHQAFKYFVNGMAEEFEEKFMDIQLPETIKIKITVEDNTQRM